MTTATQSDMARTLTVLRDWAVRINPRRSVGSSEFRVVAWSCVLQVNGGQGPLSCPMGRFR